jgi:hypothetical protein
MRVILIFKQGVLYQPKTCYLVNQKKELKTNVYVSIFGDSKAIIPDWQ